MALKSTLLILFSGLVVLHYDIITRTSTSFAASSEVFCDDTTATTTETENGFNNMQISSDHRNMVKRDANTFDSDSEQNVTFVDTVDGYNVTYTREEILAEILSYIYPTAWMWVLICFHCIVFIVGLVGNTLVCVAVYRNHTMRTVTNYFIVNLAVADFLVILFCLPPSVVWDVTSTWFFGVAMCKVVLYLQVSFIFVIIF